MDLVIKDDVTEYQKKSYDDLSSEFQRLHTFAVRAFQLIGLMYNRLTLVENLSHKDALAKIFYDHKDLPGFSKRNISRNLPLDNPYVPRRIRPPWHKNSPNEANDSTKLSGTTQERDKKPDTSINDYNTEEVEMTSVGSHRLLQKSPTEQEIATCITTAEYNKLFEENSELKEALSRQTPLIKANEISLYETEFTIPKEKYPNLKEAMRKSRDSICVIFDKSGVFEHVVPDIFKAS